MVVMESNKQVDIGCTKNSVVNLLRKYSDPLVVDCVNNVVLLGWLLFFGDVITHY